MIYKQINRAINLTCFLLIAFITGCAHTQITAPVPLKQASATAVQPARERAVYVLQPGDALDIKFYFNPELNEHVTIRPDGMISLQLVGEVKAAGLQPTELNTILTEQYTGKLSVPKLTVIVKEFAGQKIYISGEVQNPGIYPVWNNMTALQAIIQAGGSKNTAELESVVILRYQGTETPLFMTVNLKKVLESIDYSGDIPVKPYDIVFLPKTLVAKLNLMVEQYIDKLVPISRSLGLMYNLNPTIVK